MWPWIISHRKSAFFFRFLVWVFESKHVPKFMCQSLVICRVGDYGTKERWSDVPSRVSISFSKMPGACFDATYITGLWQISGLNEIKRYDAKNRCPCGAFSWRSETKLKACCLGLGQAHIGSSA